MKVDIILPLYQGKRQWIEEAISSVFLQTYTNWHLTIVDDASPTDMKPIVESLCRSHSAQITFLKLATNRRAAGARMAAIKQTNGEFIAFIDQDDRWHPRKLEKQIARLTAFPSVQAVHTDIVYINCHGQQIFGSAKRENRRRAATCYDRLSAEDVCESLFLNNTIRLSSAVVLRESFESMGGFNEALFGGEDWDFWVRFARRWRIDHIPEALLERRVHTKNTSTSYWYSRTLGLLAALEGIEKQHEYLSLHLPVHRRRVALMHRMIVAELKINKMQAARQRIRLLIQLDGWGVTAGLLFGLTFTGRLSSIVIDLYRRIRFRPKY